MIAKQLNINTNDILINSISIINNDLSKIELEYENNKQNNLLKIRHKDINKNIKLNKTIEIETNKEHNKNKNMDLVYEPLTDPKKRSLNYRKIEHHDIWNNYLDQEAANWKFDEIDFTKDYENFIKLDKPKQKVIKMILSFFANSDGIVNINITNRIMKEITAIEAFTAYSYQVVMENTHNRVYSFLLDLLIKDDKEKDDMFNSIKNINSIKLTSDWAFKWIESDEPLACRIVAFSCIEGILFSAAFAFIFWLKERSRI